MQTKSCCPQPSPPLSLSFYCSPYSLAGCQLVSIVICACTFVASQLTCAFVFGACSLAPWQCCRCRLLAVVTLLLLLLLPCLLLCLLFILLGHSVSCGAEELRSWETEELCVRYNAAISEPDSISISFCVGAKKFDLPAAIL